MARTLYLCRTPFQLLLCQQIVRQFPDETAELFYMTNIDGPKDRHYFANSAEAFAQQCYRVLRSKLDILRFATGDGQSLIRRFSAIAMGNHTLSHFRWIIERNPDAAIRTFDEGAGNFNRSGALHHDTRSIAERWRDRLLFLPDMQDVFDRSDVHFTVNATLQNVVPAERLCQLPLVDIVGTTDASYVNVIIGQPFHEYLTPDDCKMLHTAFSALGRGRYMVHPRETNLMEMPESFDIVVDDPRILEHYVADLVTAGHPVRLIGAYSTSFFTINSPAVDKCYLHIGNFPEFERLLARVGCRVFNLNDPAQVAHWADLTKSWA